MPPSPLHLPSQEGATRSTSLASRLRRRAQGGGRSRGGGGGGRGGRSSTFGDFAAALDAAVQKHPASAIAAFGSLAAAGGAMLHRNLKEEVARLREDNKEEVARLREDNARLREDIKEDFAALNSRFSRLEGWFVHHLSRGAQSGGSGGAQSGGSGGAQSGDSGGASAAS